MIERQSWYEISRSIQPGGPTGLFSAFLHFCISAFLHFCISAFLVVDDDTGLIEIGINFRPQDTRPEYIRHETAVRIRAQVVNEIFSLYIILN